MKHTFQVQKTARYFTSKAVSGEEKTLWVVLHGYRQLAEHFLRKFPKDISDDYLIAAPEGMHRFYIEGYSGRVGASWMTKEERESDIQDYVSALDKFLEDILSNFSNRPKINVLGFSQGGATAIRWICNSKYSFDELVVWAGSLPKDVDYNQNVEKLNALNLRVLIGDEDEFIDSGKIVDFQEFLKERKIDYQLIPYSGNHNIYPEVFKKLLL